MAHPAQVANFRGSLWNRWDPHIHTPGTILGDQFKGPDPWNDFNRISLILLDSTFEIALKEFIVHRNDLFPPAQYNDAEIARLFGRRNLVTNAVLQKRPSLKSLIDTANHYYMMRNKLIHERATVDVTDSDIKNYRLTVERLLNSLFDLNF